VCLLLVETRHTGRSRGSIPRRPGAQTLPIRLLQTTASSATTPFSDISAVLDCRLAACADLNSGHHDGKSGMASASCKALRASPAVTRGYGRFGRPGPYQAQFEDPVQHAGNSEIKHSSGLAGDGETRTRTGDTTIFRQMREGLEPGTKSLHGSGFWGLARRFGSATSDDAKSGFSILCLADSGTGTHLSA
jgi:hypothetical protein